MVTDISQGSSYILVSNKIRQQVAKAKENADDKFLSKKVYKSPTTYKEVIVALENKKFTLRLPNVQSRKEQVQPFIAELIEMANVG